MAQIHIFIDDAEAKQIQKKAADLGVSTSAYIRKVLKDSQRNTTRTEQPDTIKAARALVIVQAEALGRTQNASPEATDKLKKTLLKIFNQEVQ